ncbi:MULTISPECIES: glycosyltransferase family 39 protein [Acidobacterium]|uniref:Tetratricopeptide repeat protein n=1 Tax=Acidobacterium capsulatum (strain ATCC 51196 / DSM 11244 / BCRC 80197 / JCM 7670 / NBRC 15755 / NCIMB 13165 / 161) TaxID=240015 RepID=C1F909_ACIC5|nr:MULTISPECIES: glycosyltransferase family 39 protein [Acidobacterium]ACO33944.1 tetratricopeptide repeat protein [Acidobacterium capsulatum ATCC 51196]
MPRIPGWLRKHWVSLAVVALLLIQVAQFTYVVHRESLTFDEGDHSFSGYMMWKTGDYGLNPEHPPLVKLLAAVPTLGRQLWTPPLQGRFFKNEAYLDGRDWLARNDGGSQHLVFEMRMMTGLLAVGLSLAVFFMAREFFGTGAALFALTMASFDPNLLAHSALVTTDMGVTLFFLTSIYAFYRYVKKPGWGRLLLAALSAGLLIASKHSGILLAPMLVVLIAWEAIAAARGQRGRTALRLAGALVFILVGGVLVLWAFYGFRYAARPAGLELHPSLAAYAAGLSHFDQSVILTFAHWHLLPESELMGLVDVKLMAQGYPTYILGHVYAHAVWWYFPVAVLIKTTLGLLALLALTAFALVTGRLRRGREVAYLVLPAALYFAIAMYAGMDIGARHVLPLYAMAAVLVGGGIMALARREGRWVPAWAAVCGLLVSAHVASALSVFPNYLAYANRAWGGPANVHNLLSDANVDWAQQLYQVKEWRDRHPGQPCWFAYFANPEIRPSVYGIDCQMMPTADTMWMGGSSLVPPVIHGTVFISAGDLSGCEWPSNQLNPYRPFQHAKPVAMIDYGVMVYQGTFAVPQAAAMSRAQHAEALLGQHQPQAALALAQQAVTIDPQSMFGQTALGDAEAALGQKQQAVAAWRAAIAVAKKMSPAAQKGFVPDLEKKVKSMS